MALGSYHFAENGQRWDLLFNDEGETSRAEELTSSLTNSLSLFPAATLYLFFC